MPKPISFLLGGAVGAAAMYFLDPRSGRARRDEAAQQAAAQARTAAAAGEAKAREAAEKAQEAAAPGPDAGAAPLNDPALKQKVESEIFREPDAPKDRISVNVEHDVVVLRGEIDSAWLISEMEERARAVEGVVDVRNLLHTPDQAAPGAPGVPEVPPEPSEPA